MPALPAGLPVSVPPQLTLPQDLPGLAIGSGSGRTGAGGQPGRTDGAADFRAALIDPADS